MTVMVGPVFIPLANCERNVMPGAQTLSDALTN